MSKPITKRQKALRKRRIFLGCCALVLAALVSVICFAAYAVLSPTKPAKPKNPGESGSGNKTPSAVSEPAKETHASVLSTGDIMVHSTQLDGALVKETGEYDFSAFFKETAPYFKEADLAVANLEVTFGGTESGKFSGYPAFNTPDILADAIKNAGLSLLLTSNNHSYDTGLFGLKRTVQVLKQRGIPFTGTAETASELGFFIKEINGIKIGIADFTYETPSQIAGRKSLNGNILSEEAAGLINSFSYQSLESFYTEAQNHITAMRDRGVDYIVFYMHWGEEYQLRANSWQKTIAKKLSDLGVNMIIGSHPHVVQPMELIRSGDGKTETVCLYSTGNFVSNQRQEIMNPECPTGHTEDGVLLTFTLTRAKDKTVSLTALDLIPTWVNRYRGGSGYLYTVYPLESPQDGEAKYHLDEAAAAKAAKSYQRTRDIVSAGLTEIQQLIGCPITFD